MARCHLPLTLLLSRSTMLSNNIAILVLILLALASTFPASAQYSDCSSPFKCGSLEATLGYPFWAQPRPPTCGHPDFNLTCPQTGSPTIQLGSRTLTVTNVSMADRSMTLLLLTDPCAHNSSSVTPTLDLGTNLRYTSTVENVTFSYECKSSYNPPGASFTCPPKSGYLGGMTGYYATNSQVPVTKCEVNVIVPLSESGVEKMGSGYRSVVAGLKEGFGVDWVNMDGQAYCQSCTGSGGACGYNWTTHAPICFCGTDGGACANFTSSSLANIAPPDAGYGATPSTSQTSTGKSKDTVRSIAIGVVAGIVAMTILAGAGFIWYRRRHKKPQLVNGASRPKGRPSDPSALSNLECGGDSFFGVNLFDYDELEEATEFFNPSKELGEGGFGTVYHGKLGDGREVAIKRMFENNSKRVQQFMNEIEILTHLRHKNLVTLYGCTSRNSRELLLVYEYVPNGTVADHLHGRKSRLPPNAEFSPLSWRTRLSIAVETASALLYLHASDIIHRDVKTNNILLDAHSSVKVADFGLSRLFPLDLTHVSTAPQGTPGYVDPEYHQCYQLTDKSDVYSFGVVLVELISTKPAVDITRHRHEINLSNHAINKIQNDALHELVDHTLGFDDDARVKEGMTMVAELAFQCLQPDRDVRPNMEEVLEVLTRIQEHTNREDESAKKSMMESVKAEVVEITAEEALRLKSDLSPGSSSGSKEKSHEDVPHSC